MKGFWLVLLCNQPPRKNWASVYICPWSLRWKTFTPRSMHGCRWSRTLIFPSFWLGEMDCLWLSQFAFLGKKLMFPGPFICCLSCWDIICYRNLNVFRHWLMNTQINFPWDKERADPTGLLFLSSSCSNAIDLTGKPEQRGSGSFTTLREKMQERTHHLSMLTEWLTKFGRATLSHHLGKRSFPKLPSLPSSLSSLTQWLAFEYEHEIPVILCDYFI